MPIMPGTLTQCGSCPISMQVFSATLAGTLTFEHAMGAGAQGAAWSDVPTIDEQISNDPGSMFFNRAYEQASSPVVDGLSLGKSARACAWIHACFPGS